MLPDPPPSPPSPQPLNPIKLIRRRRLRPRPLAPNRQPHRVPPAPVRPDIPQPRDIIPHLPPQVVLDLHGRQLGRDVEDRLIFEGADARGGVDVEAREHVAGYLRADAVEVLEGFLGVVRGGLGVFWGGGGVR